jgi:hypothetical protein
MVMRGRTMEGYIDVDPLGRTRRSVRAWIRLALGLVQTLPPKARARKR